MLPNALLDVSMDPSQGAPIEGSYTDHRLVDLLRQEGIPVSNEMCAFDIACVVRFMQRLDHLLYNGCNGAPLKSKDGTVMTTVDSFRHSFINRDVQLSGPMGRLAIPVSYYNYVKLKYGARLKYPRAPLYRDGNGSLVALEAIWVRILDSWDV